jgi:hypothetical protein
MLLDLVDGKPERSEPFNVGTARFVSPQFPYLAHPRHGDKPSVRKYSGN